ncbi:hypothetical protein ILYODFUR_028076 [Ilyodon furcidens]|uniref:Uncharacterized protein n=1 Tax=Ilyodon furcidens TaxID=33524 RepID=A0ABV0STD3_9TELE
MAENAGRPGSIQQCANGPIFSKQVVQQDQDMDPETQDPGTYHSPSRTPTEPRGPGPGKRPPGVSRCTPKHPAPNAENHKYTGGQRHQPPQVVWRGGTRPPHLMGGLN